VAYVSETHRTINIGQLTIHYARAIHFPKFHQGNLWIAGGYEAVSGNYEEHHLLVYQHNLVNKELFRTSWLYLRDQSKPSKKKPINLLPADILVGLLFNLRMQPAHFSKLSVAYQTPEHYKIALFIEKFFIRHNDHFYILSNWAVLLCLLMKLQY
jgi:hypothetical protein